MQVSNDYSYPSAGGIGSASDNKKTDDAFARLLGGQPPEEMLHEMTKNGMRSMWEWHLEELKKKVAAEVMSAMGVTEESLKAMPDDQRADIEKKIMEEVERRVKEMVDNEMKKKNPLAGIGPGAPINAETMQGLLAANES